MTARTVDGDGRLAPVRQAGGHNVRRLRLEDGQTGTDEVITSSGHVCDDDEAERRVDTEEEEIGSRPVQCLRDNGTDEVGRERNGALRNSEDAARLRHMRALREVLTPLGDYVKTPPRDVRRDLTKFSGGSEGEPRVESRGAGKKTEPVRNDEEGKGS